MPSIYENGTLASKLEHPPHSCLWQLCGRHARTTLTDFLGVPRKSTPNKFELKLVILVEMEMCRREVLAIVVLSRTSIFLAILSNTNSANITHHASFQEYW